jgi:hypothetical protein
MTAVAVARLLGITHSAVTKTAGRGETLGSDKPLFFDGCGALSALSFSCPHTNYTQQRLHMVLPNEIILAFSTNPLYRWYRENSFDHQQDFLA